MRTEEIVMTVLMIVLGLAVTGLALWMLYKILVFILKMFTVALFIAMIVAGAIYFSDHPMPAMPSFDTPSPITTLQEATQQRQAVLDSIETE